MHQYAMWGVSFGLLAAAIGLGACAAPRFGRYCCLVAFAFVLCLLGCVTHCHSLTGSQH